MKGLLYHTFFLFVLLTSCTKESTISGTIRMDREGLWTPKVYVVDPLTFDGIASSYLGKVIDSAVIGSNGRFSLDKLPETFEPRLLQMTVQKKEERYHNKLENEDLDIANYFPIVWKSGEQIEIAAEIAHFQNSLSMESPSPENAAILHLRDLRIKAFQEFTIEKLSEINDESKLLEKEKALQKFQTSLMQFAKESSYLFPALTAIRWVSTDANYERIPEFLYDQCQKWKAVKPDHAFVTQLCYHAQRDALPIMTGDVMPDFPMPMLSGDTIALSLLLGDRVTILDLWASWCVPCRHENRDYLVPIWEKYHHEGLQIVGYALDASHHAWQGAIEKDGASRWRNASHLQGDEAPLFKALRIVTIPANFIIDGNGTVIAKNLHGDDLVKFIDAFMR